MCWTEWVQCRKTIEIQNHQMPCCTAQKSYSQSSTDLGLVNTCALFSQKCGSIDRFNRMILNFTKQYRIQNQYGLLHCPKLLIVPINWTDSSPHMCSLFTKVWRYWPVEQDDFNVGKQAIKCTYLQSIPNFVYSWSINNIWKHHFYCLGFLSCLGG